MTRLRELIPPKNEFEAMDWRFGVLLLFDGVDCGDESEMSIGDESMLADLGLSK